VPADVLAALRARLADPKVRAEVELLTTLIGTLAQVGGPGVNELLMELARDPRPPVHAAAAKALRTLGASVPEPPGDPARGGSRGLAERGAKDPLTKTPAPPGDPAKQVDQTVTWTVETTKGTFELALDPEAAPITVAALTALAEKGFYAGLLWHRVVPNFVAQGGDPTGSGWGSAGFELPAEATGARFDRGAVGIADAGRGTGSCQWFVMHTRVPHLEGRYTWIGRVAKGQDVVDALLPGDTIVKIGVTTAPRAGRLGELGPPPGQRPPDQRP